VSIFFNPCRWISNEMSRPEVRIVLLVWFGIGSGCVWVRPRRKSGGKSDRIHRKKEGYDGGTCELTTHF
jgi:hypothetical protein